jgi:hypothetical protein
MLSPTPRYHLSFDGKVSGPHGLAALREMASIQAFTRDALVTPEHTQNWQPIHALPELAAALFPATAKLQLKTKTVAITTDATTPVSVEEILRSNLSAADRANPPPDYAARPSRPPGRARNRDYAMVATLANALGVGAWFFLPHNPVVLVALVSYFAIANTGLYWVYYHVMDRY